MINIITVSRQYGSGGRDIAKRVAEELGFHCYDWEIFEEIAARTGLSQQYISTAVESADTTSPFFFNLERMGDSRFGVNLSIKDELFKTMREIVLELAQKGNCVFVGRCADFILKDFKNALHVFVYANMDFRAERVKNVYKHELSSSFKELHDMDQKRKVFYSNYTDREWGEASNYDLSLNSASLGLQRCVDIILSISCP